MVVLSPSSRRAWIEILQLDRFLIQKRVALLAEGVDRNTSEVENLQTTVTSPSSRRAWIEIEWYCYKRSLYKVALLAEGVDRNFFVLRCALVVFRRPPRGGRG